jgi:hypothetical protein
MSVLQNIEVIRCREIYYGIAGRFVPSTSVGTYGGLATCTGASPCCFFNIEGLRRIRIIRRSRVGSLVARTSYFVLLRTKKDMKPRAIHVVLALYLYQYFSLARWWDCECRLQWDVTEYG